MDAKKKAIKKIVMSRRFLPVSKLMEETKLCSAIFLDLQKKRLQLLKQLRVLQNLKISLALERLIWKKERTRYFWETHCQLIDEAIFKNYFRLSRKLFYNLCELLAEVRISNTNHQDDMSLEKGVAIALYVLGSSVEYHTVANMFGVEIEKVQKILLGFCDDVWKILAPVYLNSFPLEKDKVKNLVDEFLELGFPQCMGAVGCCHIEINPSDENRIDYHNSKGWYSIVLLGLVDARCRFIYVSSGSPGRREDSQIYQDSSLKQHLDQCSILDDLQKNISNVKVPVFIIGDSNFQLSDKLMKPYSSELLLNFQQKQFNCALSKSHKVVENTFRHLKARFNRIGIGTVTADPIQNVNAIILACCALHNFLNINNDTIDMNWLMELCSAEGNRLHPDHNILLTYNSNIAEKMRHAISSYLSLELDAASGGICGNGESAGVEGNVSGEDAGMYGDGCGEDEVIGEVTVGNNGWYIIDEFIS